MNTTLVGLIKQLFSTTHDLLAIERGDVRVADAEREVRETLALLKVRRETLTIEKRRGKTPL